MPVFNKMVYNGTEYILGGGGNIGEPLNLTVTSVGLDATITWEDNEIGTIPPTTFQKSELVRKIGSAPTSPSDGDLVVTETVKDTYKTTGYVDQGLTDGETYYYRVFSYSDLGGISYCDAVSVMISNSWQPGVNTLVYLPLDGDALDQSGNSRDGTLPSSSYYTWEYINGVSGQQCIKFKGASGDNPEVSGTYADSNIGSGDRTISFWGKFDVVGSGSVYMTHIGTQSGGTQGGWFGIYCMDGNANQIGILRYYDDPYTTSFTYDTNRHHWVITYDNTNKAKMYVDGVQVVMTQNASASFNTVGTNYYFGAYRSSDTSKRISFSNYIIEDQVRDATMISDYYDLTKGDYGIS